MKGFRKIVAIALLGAPLAAHADDKAAPAPDLQLKHAPARLHMRGKEPTVAQVTKPAGDSAAPKSTAATDADVSASVDNKYHPLPTDLRDVKERVIFKVNAGYQLDNAPASGQTLRGGDALPPGFANSRNWILGDAVVGTRDVLLPSLNSYFLGSYQFDTGDTLASRTATIVPGDATDQRVAVKAGYAEYGTEDKDGNHFWVRAGRQYRQDGGAMFAYFDGGTLGYRDTAWSVSAFGGQRVALYLDTPTGIVAGATAQIDFKKLKDVPLRVGVDYQGLSIDAPTNGDPDTQTTTTTQFRQLIAASANADLGRRAHLDLKIRFVDAGANNGIDLGIPGAGVAPSSGGIGFGRASAHLKVAASNDAMIVLDLQQRGASDLAFDLAAPSSVDVINLARTLGVGLYQPVAATLVGAQVDYRHGNLELLGFGKLNATEGTVVTTDQEGYLEAGAAIAGSPVPNTWITGQYAFRDYFLSDGTETVNHMAVSPFGDTSSTGLSSRHELALDGWWRNSSREHKVRLGGGVFYRVYNLATPYVTTTNDGRGGGRVDVQIWLTQELHLQLAGEIAQSDPTLMREIGTMESLRAALEARW